MPSPIRPPVWVLLVCAAFALPAAGGCGRREGPVVAALPACGEVPCLEVSARHAATGEALGCKVTITGVDGTLSPVWAGGLAGVGPGVWLGEGVVAIGNTVLAQLCASLHVPLHAGIFDVTVSRGLGFAVDLARVELDDDPSSVHVQDFVLAPVPGFDPFVCGDLHVHSAPSFDSDVPVEQRLVSALAEGVDVLVPTDHDAVGEWGPAVEDLGPAGLHVILGNEVTTDVWPVRIEAGHFNVFPMPDGVVPGDFWLEHASVETVIAHARAVAGGSILQLNHPRYAPWNGLFTILGVSADVVHPGLLEVLPFDTVEVFNGHELDKAQPTEVTTLLHDWFALLDVGWGAVATGSSDTHRLSGAPVGLPRTCVLADVEGGFLEGLRAGAAMVTSGPALWVTVDGVTPGGVVAGPVDAVQVDIRIGSAAWTATDTVEIWRSSELVHVAAVPVGGTLSAVVPVDDDAWIVVVTHGPNGLGTPAGLFAEAMRPFAFSNPVFIDADGDLRWTPPHR
jgi:hypothetical protein